MDSLAPEASALRAFTVLPLDQDDCENVLNFLGTTVWLKGCDHSGDDRLPQAQSTILKWVALSLEHEGSAAAPRAVLTLPEAAHDAACLAYWQWNVQPMDGERFDRGDGISSGCARISDLIDRLLTAALGPGDDASAADGIAGGKDATAPGTRSPWNCEAKAVQAFVDAARPHSDTDFGDDEKRLKDGERFIRQFAAHLAAPGDSGRYMPLEMSQASSVLQFMASVEPVEGASFCDGQEVSAGHCLVLDWMSNLVLQAGERAAEVTDA